MRCFELRAVSIAALLAVWPAVAFSDEPGAAPDATPAPAPAAPANAPAPTPLLPPPAAVTEPGCDDSGAVRKGVQRRDFLKRRRVEVSGFGGFFASDLLSTSYSAGGAISFYFTEDLGIEASLLVTQFDLDIEKPISQLFGGHRFTSGKNAFIVVGNLVWSPVHFKLRAGERAILHGDILFTLGAGDTIHDSVQGATFDVGIGFKIYPTRWLAFRVDIRDYLFVQEAISVQRLTNNLVGIAGFSVFIPFGF